MTDCFSDLHPDLRCAVAELGFTRPTPIQEKAIPPALLGRDVLACAMTGSGKTAAFLLPILERLLRESRGATRALVLSPTRELAAQTVQHFNDLACHTRLRAAAVYGGVGMQPQEQAFRRGVDVIVACPGRLLDHFSRPYAGLSDLEVLVLDEADRMLDMGFLPDVRRVLGHLPPIQQTLFFSATLPPPIVALSRDLLRNPVRLDVDRTAAPATGVRQTIYPVRQDLKAPLLVQLLRRGEIGNGLVFTRTKHRADRLARTLARSGVACDRIHGNRSQAQRTRALADFKSGRTRILVATDIAARGIDVEALSHVINFDVPHAPEDYIHRVGRTARAEATGEAFTFVSPQERSDMRAIEQAMGQRLPRREIEGLSAESHREYKLTPAAERHAVGRDETSADAAPAPAKRQHERPLRATRQARPKAPHHDGGKRSTGQRSTSSERRSSGDSATAPWWAKPAARAAGGKRRSRRREPSGR